MFIDYVLKYHLHDCIQILSETDSLSYYSIDIDFLTLFETYPDVGDNVLCYPIKTLKSCDQDLVKAQRRILEDAEYKLNAAALPFTVLKHNVHARFSGLPVCPELHRTIFPKNTDLGCFLKVTGTVVRVTQSKMLEYKKKYVCTKCKNENLAEGDFEHRYILKQPAKCQNGDPCKCSTFTQENLVTREHCKDYQELKIQEQVNKLSVGTIPGSMWVVLEDDLVDCCKPGDDVNICGVVRRRWRPATSLRRCEVELVLQANHVEVCNCQRSQVVATAPDVATCFREYWDKFRQCPIRGRDGIINAVCPQVYGLHVVKLALLLTVITGSSRAAERDREGERCKSERDREEARCKTRGQCHLLLVGDPGTGKSQLLRAGADLTPRSVFTTGTGSTRAGLTCSALREEGEWHLEAGALVLSDGGVCCIDEVGQLRDHDRTSIHEAMEQQTVSVAKAGIVCKLNTRCAIIAACNPKGHYDTAQPLSVNVSLGTPLLSRFDLIFILLDTKNPSWDELVSSYILFDGANGTPQKKRWDIEKLQMYISLVGPRVTEMSKPANQILQTYYMMQRRSELRDPSRTTVRMLDSLVRLSQAHCRLMHRSTVTTMDAVTAVSLVDLSMRDCTLSDTEQALHSTMPRYPDLSYLKTAKDLLTKLNLLEIWHEELLYYAKLLETDSRTLEADVNNGITKLFSKFDDVIDDNIPLSCSLVTSSYFNKDATKNLKPIHNDNVTAEVDVNKDTKVQVNLANALKKRASLRKKEISNGLVTVGMKRKRKLKEVNNEQSTENLLKHSKKKTREKVKLKKLDSVDTKKNNIRVEFNQKDLLNKVPSVNDIFNDIDLNVSYSDHNDNSRESIGCENVNEINQASEIRLESQEKKFNTSNDIFNDFVEDTDNNCTTMKSTTSNPESLKCNEVNLIRSESDKQNTSLNKLKQFQFKEKKDFTKFYDKAQNDKDVDMAHCKRLETASVVKSKSCSSVISNKESVSSSQISIFESSDCDIDIDF